MTYKAIFLDVDDTLVIHGKDNIPTLRVTEAVAACEQRGVVVCIATSRPLPVALPVITHLNLHGLCVIAGGAQIYNPLTQQISQEKLLPYEALPVLRVLAKEKGLKFGLFDGKQDTPLSVDASISPGQHILAAFFPEVKLDDLKSVMQELEKIPNVSAHQMLSWDKKFGWIDVAHSEATKLHGIVQVSKMMGISTHEIIGVGDGHNDYSLLLACGLKIAMGNAVPELKAIADFVAPSVEEDGVAVVIEKFILS